VTGVPVVWEDELVSATTGGGIRLKDILRSGHFGLELVADSRSRFTIKLAELVLIAMARRLKVLDVSLLQGCVEAADITGERLERVVRQTVALRAQALLDHSRSKSLTVAMWQFLPGAIGSLTTLKRKVVIKQVGLIILLPSCEDVCPLHSRQALRLVSQYRF
jgi:hypothetical protein